jgi:hypothetical protein
MANVVGKLDINRNGALLTTVDIDKSTVFTEEIPGTRLINCPIATQAVLNLKENDYVLFDDEPLSINIIPDIEVDGASPSDKYTITFEAEFYKLLDTYIKNDQGKRTFTKYGTAADHLETLIASAGNGWHVVQVDSTEEFLLDYNDTYIRGGLNMIAEAAGLEWDAFYKGITMRKTIGRDTGLVFEVGRGKGLHKIKRSPDASKSVITRLYGKGGTRNITSKYRDGAQTNLIIEGEYIQTAGVTAGTERVKEGTYTNEKIFPHFKGVVGAVTVAKNSEGVVTSFTIVDTAINFNINSQLQEGIKAKVGFLTGALTGIEFEVESYNASTKVLVLIPNKDTNNYITPNDLNLPEVGDKWTVYDIIMPDAYFVTSEAELRAEMVTYLEENRFQNLIFDTKPSPKYLRDNQIRLRGGDTVKAVQAAIGVNEILRFIKISFPVVDRFDVTGTIGNKIVYSEVTKLFADVLNTTKQVQQIDRRAAIIAKRNSQNLKVLADSIFDVDGNFDATKFNVGVLSALLGIFGLQSSDFLLSKVFITANFGGDINAVNISAGELIHLEYTHGGTDNIWQMQPITQSGLVAGNKYYVYSKISTTSNAGTFIITTDQLKPNDNLGFYTLRTGIIYPVNGGYRDADFTYGITTINGRQIKAGIIEGNTGALSLNLDTGDIFGKLTFRASNGTIKDVAAVDNKAALADANALAAQITADNAKGQAEGALKELADIADDGILDASEKVSELKNWRLIESELPLVQQQANAYGVSITDYNAKFTALGNYVTPLFANMNVNSPIDRTEFINKFKDYYNARQAVYNAIANATKSLVDNISVGGVNMIQDSSFERGYLITDAAYIGLASATNAANAQNGSKIFYIDGSGDRYAYITNAQFNAVAGKEYTISFYTKTAGPIFGTSSYVFDQVDHYILNFDNSTSDWNRSVIVFKAVRSGNHSLRFGFFSNSYAWMGVDCIQVEEGNTVTPWKASSIDLQADLDAAIAKGTEALRQLAEISNDGILDVSEKTTIRKEFEVIYYEKNILVEQANTFNVSSVNYVAYWTTLINLLQNYWLADMTIATPVDRTQFNTAFENYYSNRANLYKFITDAANGKIVDINFGGINLLKNSGEFTSGDYWINANLGGTFTDGTGCIFSTDLEGHPLQYSEPLALKPNTIYTYSGWLYSELGYTGTNGKIQPLHFWLGNTPNNNNYAQEEQVIALDQYVPGIGWKYYYVTFRTPNSGSTIYMRPYVYMAVGQSVGSRMYATNLQVAEESKPTPWKKSAFQISREAQDKANAAINAANAYADSVALSKANIAQAAAIAAAQSDAQSRAETAYTNAVAASNSYAQTAANGASSTAQIAAAADASNKATKAYNDAVANANALYNQLTNSLKGLAYQDFVELSKLGSTVVENGRIKAVLLDVQAIWANIIEVGLLRAQDIEALTLVLTKGVIGGWNINNQAISSPNLLFGGVPTMQMVAATNSIEFNTSISSGSVWNSSTQNWEGVSVQRNIGSKVDPDGLYIRSQGVDRGVSGAKAALHLEAVGDASQGMYVSAAPDRMAAWINGNTQLYGAQYHKIRAVYNFPYYCQFDDHTLVINNGNGTIVLPNIGPGSLDGREMVMRNNSGAAVTIQVQNTTNQYIISDSVSGGSSFSIPPGYKLTMKNIGSYWVQF